MELFQIEPYLPVGSSAFLAISNLNEIDTYMCILTYRIQRNLYTLYQGPPWYGDLPWDYFVLILGSCQKARVAARIVLRRTLENFFDHGEYRFDITPADLLHSMNELYADGTILRATRLFPADEGRIAVEGILLHAEQAYYEYLSRVDSVRNWHEYLSQLLHCPDQWNALRRAFYDALLRLDFRSVWQAEDLEDAISREEDPADGWEYRSGTP